MTGESVLRFSSSKEARNILDLQPHEKEAMNVGSQNNSNLFRRMCMIERLVPAQWKVIALVDQQASNQQ